MDVEKEREALLRKLALLENIRKLHEWTIFGQKEAEEIEKLEKELESEDSESDKK